MRLIDHVGFSLFIVITLKDRNCTLEALSGNSLGLCIMFILVDLTLKKQQGLFPVWTSGRLDITHHLLYEYLIDVSMYNWSLTIKLVLYDPP